jgi:hypothetical protein
LIGDLEINYLTMRDIYSRIFGEEFMNSPVQGTKEEAQFMEKKMNEFIKKQEMDISILKKVNNYE